MLANQIGQYSLILGLFFSILIILKEFKKSEKILLNFENVIVLSKPSFFIKITKRFKSIKTNKLTNTEIKVIFQEIKKLKPNNENEFIEVIKMNFKKLLKMKDDSIDRISRLNFLERHI